ncbi:MAG: MBL fold metallo-hydrolase, partial [Sphingobacteriales bacterium]
MIIVFLLVTVSVVGIATITYLQQPQFGRVPTGDRLERVRRSPNYRDGQFQNLSYTPVVGEGYSMSSVMYDFLFGKHPRTRPLNNIPSVKTDLLSLPRDTNVLVWFSHSSYFLQIDGKRILVDPVFSGNASPLPGTTRAFGGSDIYTADEMPQIDMLLISHDHYDHLDYKTIRALRPKIKQVICGLGVGEHFEAWGYEPQRIAERDWNETIVIDDSFRIHTTVARHFSGRKLKRNTSLWMSFVLETGNKKLFIGGDSGYDTHFADIGNRFGPFDLVILENGQYNEAWRAIHMLPEDVLTAASDLKAKKVFPVHSSKFKLALHAWDEPLESLSNLNRDRGLKLVTPMIGEVVRLDDGLHGVDRRDP